MSRKLIYSGAEESRQKTKEEYLILLSMFQRFIDEFQNNAEYDGSFESLCELRFSFLFDRVLDGLQLGFSQALDILRGAQGLDTELRNLRDIVVAAVDNLIEFAVYEEFEMVNSLPEADEEEEVEDIFKTYNLDYAITENEQVLYAAEVALWLTGVEANEILTYMTQQDERVRDSHALLEGYTAYKNSFPPELIPPIDWMCRCYLTASSSGIVGALTKKSSSLNDFSDVVNPVFSSSLSVGGKIFSYDHPYFNVNQSTKNKLDKIVRKIKNKLYGK